MNLAEDKSGIVVPKRPLKPVLLSLLILVSGILIGSGLTFISMQRNIPKNPEPGPEYFSERMMRHMVHELQLTAEQEEQLEPIIKKHFESMNQIRIEARPKISEEIKQMNEAMLMILTEPQKKMWEDRVQRMREVSPRDGREGFGPGRGPGQRFRGPEGEDRRPADEEGFRDRRRLWRNDPNMPERPDERQGPMGPPPFMSQPKEPNSPPATF
jgi:hypothetical protein